jgi:hypothetical protein
MPEPFLVYELTPDRSSWGRRDRWSSREQGRNPGGPNTPNLPVGLKADLLGCFVADDQEAACSQAAEAVQRPGSFLAIKGDHFAVTFTAGKSDDALKRLSKPPGRRGCGCDGDFICDVHRVVRLVEEKLREDDGSSEKLSDGEQ